MIFCGNLMSIYIKKIALHYSILNRIFQDEKLFCVLEGFL